MSEPHVYRPSPIDFLGVESSMRQGREQISKNAELTIDATDLGDSKTLAICALVEWMRHAAAKNRRLKITNLPLRLRQLIQVYQLDPALFDFDAAADSPTKSDTAA